jgi:glycosyltransferase involved in cell wall biosynthesis
VAVGSRLSDITVAAALIVRNEERFLFGCLQCLRGCVDEVVVVDTGSEDTSIDIARAVGAVVLHHKWSQDFAAARNAGLDAVTCNWVLSIDADERLHLPRGGAVADYLDASAIAVNVRFKPKTGYTRYPEARLFRNDRRLRFAGRVHETIVPLLREISVRENLPIIESEVEIDHLGYDGDQSEKRARNLPLLQEAVRTNPDRVYYWYHLAETLAALGRTEEALDAAREGLASAERNPTDEQTAGASLIIQAIARLELERGQNPLSLIEKGLARVPEDYGLLFLYGRALLAAARPHEALEVATRLRKVDPDELTRGLLAFDRSIFEEKARELAAFAGLQIAEKVNTLPVR